MYLGHIAGIIFLPISILIFLNQFAITHLQSVFGLDLLIIASIGLLLVEIGDIITSHFAESHVVLSWIVCLISCIPALAYFLSKFIAFPESVVTALPIIIASFLFIEGVQSFYLGEG